MAQSSMAEMEKQMSMCMEMMEKTQEGTPGGGTMGSGTTSIEKVADPVCGMEVVDTKAAPTVVYKAKTYYFCSEEDKAKFQKNPEQYVRKDS
jgi:YHS domain-containing protein